VQCGGGSRCIRRCSGGSGGVWRPCGTSAMRRSRQKRRRLHRTRRRFCFHIGAEACGDEIRVPDPGPKYKDVTLLRRKKTLEKRIGLYNQKMLSKASQGLVCDCYDVPKLMPLRKTARCITRSSRLPHRRGKVSGRVARLKPGKYRVSDYGEGKTWARSTRRRMARRSCGGVQGSLAAESVRSRGFSGASDLSAMKLSRHCLGGGEQLGELGSVRRGEDGIRLQPV